MTNTNSKNIKSFRLKPETTKRLKDIKSHVRHLTGRWPKDQDDLLNKLIDCVEKIEIDHSIFEKKQEQFNKLIKDINK